MADDLTTQSATPATVPASTIFATKDIGGKQYIPQLIADGTTPTQRLGVDSSGRITVRPWKGTKTFTDPAPTNTAAVALAANSSRITAVIQNVGTVDVYIGKDNTVTTTNGLLLAAGASLTDDSSTDAWWGITASGTADLRILEVA